MIGPERCGGVVALTADGVFIERHGCEVHLFHPGLCGWQLAMIGEREALRSDRKRADE